MRAVASQASPTRTRPVPLLLVRDLATLALLSQDRPSARHRLERVVGRDFAERLLAARMTSARVGP
jgi:hypothetical protein